jgi:hypothetical protein
MRSRDRIRKVGLSYGFRSIGWENFAILTSPLLLALDKFETIAPRIVYVEPLRIHNILIFDDRNAPRLQGCSQVMKVGYHKCGMRFFGSVKIFFDADVQLIPAALEPATAAGAIPSVSQLPACRGSSHRIPWPRARSLQARQPARGRSS